MLVSFLGDQSMYIGLIAKSGVAFLQMAHYRGRRCIVRHNLNHRLPDVRLNISGEGYVH
jgi:hypothetical protein